MIRSKVIKFGNNVDTDQIIPAQYLSLSSIDEMKGYTFEYDSNFTTNFKEGNILIAGENFGCGSSREQAPAVLKARGVSAIIAKDFARIFYRNSINLGIPLIECNEIDDFSNNDLIEVDLKKGSINNVTTGKKYSFSLFPEFIEKILNAGGIINYKKMA